MNNHIFKIDSDVPMPPVRRPNNGRPMLYPVEQMEVGDSFFVAGVVPDNFYANMARWRRRFNAGYQCRVVDGGVRIWRTA